MSDTPNNWYKLSPANRQAFSLLSSKPVKIAGSRYSINNGKSTLLTMSGSIYEDNPAVDGIVFDLSTNELLKNIPTGAKRKAVMTTVNEEHKSVEIVPFTGYCPSAPYLDMLDEIVIKDPDRHTRITHISHRLNCWTKIETSGEEVSPEAPSTPKTSSTTISQTQSKNYVELREKVKLLDNSTGYEVGNVTEKIENLSKYSAFIVVLKRASDSGLVPVFCTKGYHNGNKFNTIRGNFIWRQNTTTVYEYYVRFVDDGFNRWTIGSIDYYTVTSGTAVKSADTLRLVEIYALS